MRISDFVAVLPHLGGVLVEWVQRARPARGSGSARGLAAGLAAVAPSPARAADGTYPFPLGRSGKASSCAAADRKSARVRMPSSPLR